MNARVKFFGGAGTVTGSKYLLEINDFRILIDCGLFQGFKELRLRNWEPLEMNPASINAVIITHAHIDHSGYLPRLVKDGFKGPVYCTDATADLLEIMLLDSAKLQEEEAKFAKKKGYSKHENPEPLYNVQDAKKALENLQPVRLEKQVKVANGIHVEFVLSGHILGAASVKLTIVGESQEKTIVFSGDLGRYDDAMHDDPSPIHTADVLFVESTYGDRVNPSRNPEKELAAVINRTLAREGCVLIPAFAVGRTQLVLYYLSQLFDQNKIPKVPVYIDSPMALAATNLYKRHSLYHKLRPSDEHFFDHVFEHPQFNYIREQAKSVALNNIKSNVIIISASGMCTGGRVVHHLFHRLPRENDTVLFVGYQGGGTRGRRIQDGEASIKMFGQMVEVKCHVESIDGLSAHADQTELLRWLGNLVSPPKFTFLVHGEPKALLNYQNKIKEKLDMRTTIPEYMETFQLFDKI